MLQFTLEEAAGHLPELVREAQGGHEIVFTDGRFPVARLIPVAGDTLTGADMSRLAVAGRAFDWLADEPDLYDDTCGEAIH